VSHKSLIIHYSKEVEAELFGLNEIRYLVIVYTSTYSYDYINCTCKRLFLNFRYYTVYNVLIRCGDKNRFYFYTHYTRYTFKYYLYGICFLTLYFAFESYLITLSDVHMRYREGSGMLRAYSLKNLGKCLLNSSLKTNLWMNPPI